MEHVCAMWQVYFSGAYASNVEYMCISASGHIVVCNEFI